jgi:hypothetical protein
MRHEWRGAHRRWPLSDLAGWPQRLADDADEGAGDHSGDALAERIVTNDAVEEGRAGIVLDPSTAAPRMRRGLRRSIRTAVHC